MSRLMEDLDLSPSDGCDDYDFPCMASESSEHASNLRKALEAALNVVAMHEDAWVGNTIQLPCALRELEATLSPFKRKGGGV